MDFSYINYKSRVTIHVNEKRFLKVYVAENHFEIVVYTVIEILLSRFIVLKTQDEHTFRSGRSKHFDILSPYTYIKNTIFLKKISTPKSTVYG